MGSLADGDYYFKVYTDSGCTTEATKVDGSTVGEIKLTISGGVSATTPVEGLAAGTYYVKETRSSRKDITLDQNPKQVTVTAGVKGADTTATAAIATVTNTYETTKVEGNKTWYDESGKTYTSAPTLTLKRSSTTTTEETVSATPVWTNNYSHYEYKDLPKKDSHGNEYTYTVTETPPEGYVMSQDGYNFTNTAISSISKTKAFEGGWPADTTVTFTLSAAVDGSTLALSKDATGANLTLSKDATSGNETVEWTNLKKYENGTLIIYTVTETKVTIGTTEYTGDEITDRWSQSTGEHGELVNTWKTTERHAKKEWAGDSKSEHVRDYERGADGSEHSCGLQGGLDRSADVHDSRQAHHI